MCCYVKSENKKDKRENSKTGLPKVVLISFFELEHPIIDVTITGLLVSIFQLVLDTRLWR